MHPNLFDNMNVPNLTSNWLREHRRCFFFYRSHPKDGEGNVFTGVLSVHTWPGGGGVTPSASHNTSTGSMSFLGFTKVTGPRSLLEVVPRSQAGAGDPPPPQMQNRTWIPPWTGRDRTGSTTPWPGQNWGYYPLVRTELGYSLSAVQEWGTPSYSDWTLESTW